MLTAKAARPRLNVEKDIARAQKKAGWPGASRPFHYPFFRRFLRIVKALVEMNHKTNAQPVSLPHTITAACGKANPLAANNSYFL